MTPAQASLFDRAPAPASPPPPAAPRRTAADYDALNRVMALQPATPAQGLNRCAAPFCLGPIGDHEPVLCGDAYYPDSVFGPGPPRAKPVSEILTFHTACHERWWAEKVAQAWAVVDEERGRPPK